MSSYLINTLYSPVNKYFTLCGALFDPTPECGWEGRVMVPVWWVLYSLQEHSHALLLVHRGVVVKHLRGHLLGPRFNPSRVKLLKGLFLSIPITCLLYTSPSPRDS